MKFATHDKKGKSAKRGASDTPTSAPAGKRQRTTSSPKGTLLALKERNERNLQEAQGIYDNAESIGTRLMQDMHIETLHSVRLALDVRERNRGPQRARDTLDDQIRENVVNNPLLMQRASLRRTAERLRPFRACLARFFQGNCPVTSLDRALGCGMRFGGGEYDWLRSPSDLEDLERDS